MCLIGFHSVLPKTATSMAMPKENMKNGKVKDYFSFFARLQWIRFHSVASVIAPMTYIRR